ncbi:MAG: hypothetical protein L0Z50_20975, partial [Verrucomicrobiales bacterium]|nr:hypothetical protein [Verrucomicrobiales bacterium]
MSKAISSATFDYSQVEPDEKGKLIRLAGQLKKHGDAMLLAGNEIRKVLAEAHSMLAHHRAGLFDEWVQTESDVSLSTAYNCINLEKRAPNFPILESLPPTVAYFLSGPKVSDKAIQEFEKQVNKGVKPTIEAAKAILKRFRTVKPKGGKSQGVSDSPKAAEPSAGDRQKSSPQSEPEKNEEAELNAEPVKELTFEDQVKDANRKIESFCRDLTKFFEEHCPKLESVDHLGRYDSALAQIKAACGTLRTCKYHDEPCPK